MILNCFFFGVCVCVCVCNLYRYYNLLKQISILPALSPDHQVQSIKREREKERVCYFPYFQHCFFPFKVLNVSHTQKKIKNHLFISNLNPLVFKNFLLVSENGGGGGGGSVAPFLCFSSLIFFFFFFKVCFIQNK